MRVFPRIREITNSLGERLRVSIEEHPSGVLVVLERPDKVGRPRLLLDGYGADILGGFIMSARLSVPHGMPDEQVDGLFATQFQLQTGPTATILMRQNDSARFELAAPFWDRLYAELCLIAAHARAITQRNDARVH
jgi:hypothetical protein